MSRRPAAVVAVLGGLVLVAGVLTWALAYRHADGLSAGHAPGLVLPGGRATDPRPAAPSGEPVLLYLSPEQYSSLVTASRVQQAGELATAVGLPALVGAAGWWAARRPG
ncbi:hypothetical protein [Modestobacter sp. NPDC049651]|uniref:hypothetical protein n=1 Tax=unclassified Modestobacter TaxID=2643866 RepID=UPI0033FE8341